MKTDNFYITEYFPSKWPKTRIGKFEIFLSSVWYIIKQLYHSRLLDIYELRVADSHPLSKKAHIQQTSLEVFPKTSL